ncbi:hypothetical protein SAMN05444413_104254 [Roseivivax marinus]|nr:hypothetical protein SAMN05444413_104254 [Roseivivax marinus]
MSMRFGTLPRLSDLVEGAEITPDMIVRLAALALMQAHIVAEELHDIVIPLLPPARRSHAASIVRRIERGAVLEEEALHDVETFNAALSLQIEAGTQVYWQGDDNHVRGGYEAVYREPEARQLAEVAGELALLADMILAALSAARAVREAAALIDG